MITAADLAPINQKYPTLDAWGFDNKFRSGGKKGGPRPEAVQLCIEWLLHHDGLERRKTVNKRRDSYSWKHVVERAVGEYISNGEFIYAALYMNYKMSREKDSPNAFFNIRDPKPE